MIIDKKYINGYYGIFREIVLTDTEVIVRFNALGNDEIDLQFFKKYPSKKDALLSLTNYIKETTPASIEERGPSDGNWIDFENKVNKSVIKLFRETIGNQIKLPDNGTGYILSPKKDLNSLKSCVDQAEQGITISFVSYENRM